MRLNNEAGARAVGAKPITKKEFAELFPNGGAEIVGEVAIKGSRKDSEAETYMDCLGSRRAVLAPGTLPKFWQTTGYLPFGEAKNAFIAVKANRLPVFIVIGLAVLALIAALLVWLLNPNGPDIDPFAKKYKSPTLERPDGAGADEIAIPGYSTWQLADGTTDLKVALANAEGNPCYMKYTVTLKDTGETLYQSKLIPPGEAITEFQISHALPQGDNPIMIHIDTYDINDFTKPLNNADVATSIYVG